MAENYFKMSLLDVEKFCEVNELKEITNPIYFKRDNIPTEDGLLSNEIFGITKYDRANIFAYIDLVEDFIHPLLYKRWCKLDGKIKEIVYGNKNFSLDENNYIVEDEDGETGVQFLKKNIKKIEIPRTQSAKRDTDIKFIKENIDKMFIRKLPVIPAFYRDVNTGDRMSGVGDINKLYNSILISVRSIKEVADYGLPLENAVKGRIQDLILQVYNWFCDEPQLAKKNGIMKRAIQSKTVDYGARLVITAPDIDAERYDELYVDLDYCGLPLSAACVNFYPYMIFFIRRFFENEFATGKYPYMNKETGKVEYVTVKEPHIAFSDDVIKHEIDRFLKGFSNRFIPIKVPNEEGKNIYMRFKGRSMTAEEFAENPNNRDIPIMNRKLTWCDVFFIAANEACQSKHVLLTRYPMDSKHNMFPSKIRILSTRDTEPMQIGQKFYEKYPKIRDEDLGKDTSNKFINSLQIANPLLNLIGGDYDGDQLTSKAVFTEEANEELEEFMNKPSHYITEGGINGRILSNEAVQTIFNLTRVYDNSLLTQPEF